MLKKRKTKKAKQMRALFLKRYKDSQELYSQIEDKVENIRDVEEEISGKLREHREREIAIREKMDKLLNQMRNSNTE